MPTSIVSIQWLRALAALAVVAFHAEGRVPWPTSSFYTVGGAAGVDLFFVISGFIMWVTTVTRPIGPIDFMRLRIVRIVPVYWLFTTLILLAVAAAPSLFPRLQINWSHTIASYLFIPWPSPSDGKVWPLLVQGWTLNYEMFFYLVFAMCLLLPVGLRLRTITLVLAGLVLTGLLVRPGNPIAQTYTDRLLLEFLAGVWIGRAWMSGCIRLSQLVATVAFLAALLAIASTLSLGDAIEDYRLLVWGVPAVILVIAGLALERKFQSLPALGRVLGDASYSIYLVHGMVAAAMAKVWKAAQLSGGMSAVLFVIATMVISALAGWLSYRLVERPLIGYFRNAPHRLRRARVGAAD
jgi:exopolysaccharide production protein ExoZ